MNRTELLLTILSEECAETSQRVSKALRFTLNEKRSGQDMTNAEQIIYEFNDIVAMMEILHDEGVFDRVIDRDMIEEKKRKVSHYLQYSEQTGALRE